MKTCERYGLDGKKNPVRKVAGKLAPFGGISNSTGLGTNV